MKETLGLYISVPFCRAKCTYCNFASGVFPAGEHGRYVARVCEELRNAPERADRAGWRLPDAVGSVYLGGGTPSTLDPERLQEIFATIGGSFPLDPDTEVTVECAPGQIAPAFLQAMVEVSVTRVSLGVQSMVDAEASAAGRTHVRSVVEEDVRRLHKAGMAVNVDLIAGLPGQTMSSWAESLEAVCGLGAEHASLYMLEVDEDSRLGRELIGGGTRYGAGLVPNDDAITAMYEAGCARLERAGLWQYEISNFAQVGAKSRHNRRYWLRQPYLGAGLDAHSMLRNEHGRAVRFGNTDELQGYLEGVTAGDCEVLDAAAELEEAWFLGLRLTEGVSLRALAHEFGAHALGLFEDVVAGLVRDGLLVQADDRLALTNHGRLLSNEVFGRFLGVQDGASEAKRAVTAVQTL